MGLGGAANSQTDLRSRFGLNFLFQKDKCSDNICAVSFHDERYVALWPVRLKLYQSGLQMTPYRCYFAKPDPDLTLWGIE